MSRIKAINISLAVALVFSILISLIDFDAKCEDLRENVFRLHIIANSDSEEDQQLKLKVRDAILRESESLFLSATDLESAQRSAESNIEIIEKIANDTLSANGSSDKAVVSVGKTYFDTRVYDEYTLPAGEYNALRVEIGKAEGKNWWCVLFPSICVGACVGLDETAQKGAEIARNGDKYIVKFKIVEVYEDIKSKIFRRK